MRGPLVLLLSMASLLGGCTHRTVVPLGASLEVYREINEATALRDAEILTRSGQIFRWYDVNLSPDSTWGVVIGSGGPRPPAVPTEDVLEVTVRSRWRGALEGTAIGAGLGAVVGLLAGPDDASCTELCADTSVEQALILGVGGAIWGVVIGAVRGSRTKLQPRR